MVPRNPLGLAWFAIGAKRNTTNAFDSTRNAIWLAPWFGGQVVIGWLGRYGGGSRNILPNWIDIAVVVVFSLVIYYWAVAVALPTETIQRMIDEVVLPEEEDLAVPSH